MHCCNTNFFFVFLVLWFIYFRLERVSKWSYCFIVVPCNIYKVDYLTGMTNIVPLWPAQSHDMGPIQSPLVSAHFYSTDLMFK